MGAIGPSVMRLAEAMSRLGPAAAATASRVGSIGSKINIGGLSRLGSKASSAGGPLAYRAARGLASPRTLFDLAILGSLLGPHLFGDDEVEDLEEFLMGEQADQNFRFQEELLREQELGQRLQTETLLKQATRSASLGVPDVEANIVGRQTAEEQLNALLNNNELSRLAIIQQQKLPGPAEVMARAGIGA